MSRAIKTIWTAPSLGEVFGIAWFEQSGYEDTLSFVGEWRDLSLAPLAQDTLIK